MTMSPAPERMYPSPIVRELILMRAREQIRRMLANKENIDAMLLGLVEHMRLIGATWEQIGDALGVSKQAAAKKYGKVDEAIEALGVGLNSDGDSAG